MKDLNKRERMAVEEGKHLSRSVSLSSLLFGFDSALASRVLLLSKDSTIIWIFMCCGGECGGKWGFGLWSDCEREEELPFHIEC